MAFKFFKGTSALLYGKSTDYHALGAIYLPEASRFENLLKLPEGSNIGKQINLAMTLIENNNPKLDGILPKNYSAFDNDLLVTLLKTFASIPMMEGDVFGKIYEYFLGEFAKDEGSKGGEFFTPTSLVKLIVEVIEPFHGRIFDPACGSGGMFVTLLALLRFWRVKQKSLLTEFRHGSYYIACRYSERRWFAGTNGARDGMKRVSRDSEQKRNFCNEAQPESGKKSGRLVAIDAGVVSYPAGAGRP
jgi:type I restriction-modification system DNA methylase subunit